MLGTPVIAEPECTSKIGILLGPTKKRWYKRTVVASDCCRRILLYQQDGKTWKPLENLS